MKIKIFSDIACPYCYIGVNRLVNTINEFYPDESIELEHKPFQLNPNLPKVEESSYYEYLMNNYGISQEEVQEMIDKMIKYGEDDGIEFNVENIKNVNTFDAHRFIMFTHGYGLSQKAVERLMKAYFTEGKNIADFEILADIGEEIGINRDKVISMLNSDDLVGELNSELITARYSGITSVPYFIFDDYYSLKGAQPKDVFKEVIEETLKDMK